MAESHLHTQFGSCLAHTGNIVDGCGSHLVTSFHRLVRQHWELPGELLYSLWTCFPPKECGCLRDLFQAESYISGEFLLLFSLLLLCSLSLELVLEVRCCCQLPLNGWILDLIISTDHPPSKVPWWSWQILVQGQFEAQKLTNKWSKLSVKPGQNSKVVASTFNVRVSLQTFAFSLVNFWMLRNIFCQWVP